MDMTERLSWDQLSEEGKSFVSAFGQSEDTIDYIIDTAEKTIIVLKNKERTVFDWRKIHSSAI